MDDKLHLKTRNPPTDPIKLATTGNGTTWHHARARVGLLLHPELSKLSGPDCRGSIFIVGAWFAHLGLAAVLVPACASALSTILLALTLGTVVIGIKYNQFHEGMHGLNWTTRFGNRVLDALCLAMPFTNVYTSLETGRQHSPVHHAFTFGESDPDTHADLYDSCVGGIGFWNFLQLPLNQRILRHAVEIASMAVKVALTPLKLHAIAARYVLGDVTANERKWIPRDWYLATVAIQDATSLLHLFVMYNVFGREAFPAAVANWLLFGWVARFTNYSPAVCWTASTGSNLLDHLLAKPGQPSSSTLTTSYLIASVGFGYHLEHHDFPRVPSWKLPQVRRIAPELYREVKSYTVRERLWLFFAKQFSKAEIAEQCRQFDALESGTMSMDLCIDTSGLSPELLAAASLLVGRVKVLTTPGDW
jgi:fatty acid desaturase